MTQKIVTFEVSKALNDVGYPQGDKNITEIGWYNQAGVFTKELPLLWKGDDAFVALAPTYLDAWLWLWREKGIKIVVGRDYICVWLSQNSEPLAFESADPEEAIAKAIDFLVDKNLIK